MRKIALAAALAVVALAARPRPAQACSDADLIPDWFVAGFAGSLVLGYVGGTSYFVVEDLGDARRDKDYIGGEIAFNGVFAAAWGVGAVDAIQHHHGAAAVPLVGMTALHGALLVHGVRNVNIKLPELDGAASAWVIGSGYALETLMFLDASHTHHSRKFGAFEAAVNAPLAAGLGYLAYQAQQERSDGHALLFTGMAAVSAAIAIDGMRTAISPHRPAKLDLLGTDLMPTVVDDGRELGAGLGTSGTF